MPVSATYTLAVDWDVDASFATAGDDITADVLSVECRRGRDYASALTGKATTGRLIATLDNRDGTYSPFNSSSALFGKLLPGRPVRLRANFASTDYTLWQGFLESIVPSAISGAGRTAQLIASGPFVKLTNKDINPAANSGALTSTIIGEILDAASWPAGDRTIATGQTTTGRWFVQKKKALTALREIEETELGFVYEGADGKIVFEDRHYRITGARLTSQATFSDAGGAANPYESIVESDHIRDIVNEAKITVQPYAVAAEATLWTLTGETPQLLAGASRTFTATYPNSGATTGAYVETWTTPTAGTEITQTGVADSDVGIAVVKAANSMEITITNNHASATLSLTLVSAKGTAVTKSDPTDVVSEDSSSQTTYGERTWGLASNWLPSTQEAQYYADDVVRRYKSPVPVLVIGWTANKSTNLMTQGLTRVLSERVTVTANGNAKLGLSGDFHIEAIAHRISQGGTSHQVSIELSQVDTAAPYWILGTSQLGVDTKLGSY